MLEKLGNKKIIAPFIIVVVIGCFFALIFYPNVSMTPKDLPFAILNLDEGAETPQGSVNAGEAIIENITSMESSETDSKMPVIWTEISSQAELDEALENNEYYGALIIPADFTQSQVAFQMASGAASPISAADIVALLPKGVTLPDNFDSADPTTYPEGLDPSVVAKIMQDAASSDVADTSTATNTEEVAATSLQLIIDNAKSPMVASLMQSSMVSIFDEAAIDVEVTVIHNGNGESGSMMSVMMSQQIAIMPLFLMSVIGAALTFLILRPSKSSTRSERWKSIGLQSIFAAGVSLLAGLTTYCILTWVVGVDIPVVGSILFLWLASFCVMLMFLGAFNIAFGIGVLLILIVMGCGMATGMLPYEVLPAFWQDWVYPWAPQRFIGGGLRDIMFMGTGAWNNGSGPLLISGMIGLLVLCLSGLKTRRSLK
jgi:hypothetical protein